MISISVGASQKLNKRRISLQHVDINAIKKYLRQKKCPNVHLQRVINQSFSRNSIW